MTEIRIPLSITYETTIPTPIADVISALMAADAIASETISILPSLIDGLQIEECSLNVHSLTEGSLKEALFLALLVTYQGDLQEEVPPVLEDLFKITVSDKYDTIVTVVFLTVLFYGTGMAIDMAKKAFTDSLPRSKLNELIDLLALETGKSASDIRKIVEAKFQKPAAVKRLVRESKRFFLPSQKDANAPITFDRDRIPKAIIGEVPFPGDGDRDQDFDRYTPHEMVSLEIHAQDKDKSAVGWAAVADGISEKRLKVRIVDPVNPADLWQKEEITADIVVVSKLTSDGYTPSEIQITAVHSSDGDLTDPTDDAAN
ncbi:hypothetical protein DSM110277_02059 [Sulfitobacter pontiacus]|uniref:Uncharacterized protein n=1 Tax=Sulfitobacter pontiacus TaxID=60137 RepID=A0AAX3AEL0_9RHOB|nr:hypothetical protein [Sulfitobacter pontiacus]UOA23630.1 hypothetical protein DSM110277_02059 [Sulfitobacter pontiacus]